MSTKPEHPESTGKLVRVCQGFVANDTDCSSWDSDIPEEQWSEGKFVSDRRSLSAIEVDCSAWETGASVWLELVVTFADGTPPTRVIEHTSEMIRRVHAVDPALGLTYDFTLSRTEGGQVIIALAPANGNHTESRLQAIANVIQSKLVIMNARVRLARAA